MFIFGGGCCSGPCWARVFQIFLQYKLDEISWFRESYDSFNLSGLVVCDGQ